MRNFLCGSAGCVAIAVASFGASFKISTAVLEGNAVPGVGNVTGISSIAINNAGTWSVEIDTDGPTTADIAILRPGSPFTVLYQEGQPISPPAGATISSFGAVRVQIDNNGDAPQYMTLDGVAANLDSGVYRAGGPVLLEGTVATAPQFSANTPYIGFFGAVGNDAGQTLVMASVDDPAIASSVDRALVLVDALGAQAVIAKEGDVLAAPAAAIADFGTGRDTFDLNAAGQAMYIVDTTAASNDAAIYVDTTPVAVEGGPSPVAGRNWAVISTSDQVSLNASGGYALKARLEGDAASDTLIERSGVKVIQEGDAPPGVTAFVLSGFGNCGPKIDNLNNVLWYGDWNDPNTLVDTGLFWNQTPVLREGITQIGGAVLDEVGVVSGFGGITNTFELSDNGRWIIFRGILDDGNVGAFVIGVCFEDVDGNGSIDDADLGLLLASFGLSQGDAGFDPRADFDNDGDVTDADLGLLLNAFGVPCPG